VAIVGGAKVSTKLELLGNLVGKVDHLVIGGGMANTFLAAQGLDVGASLAEHDMTQTARDILAKADSSDCTIHLPSDVVVAREFKAQAAHETVPAAQCPSDAMILDAGPETVATLKSVFDSCKTLIWNGPLGAFELDPFDAATNAAAEHAAGLTQSGSLIICGRWWRHGCRAKQIGCGWRSLAIFRPRVARFWNGWRARHCPVLPRFRNCTKPHHFRIKAQVLGLFHFC
jgi:3-phosphoglycerate kinase